MKKKYEGVVIADIHFGSTNITHLKRELEEVFLQYIESMDQLNFIIFDGDYFDKRLSLNDDSVSYAIEFMNQVIEIAKKHHNPDYGEFCPIRIIYGTESHESNQYGIFDVYKDRKDIDFRIIKTVSDEEILPQMHVLYLPEEYMVSKEDFYKDYLYSENSYDYIFGHGVINDIMVSIKSSSESSSRKKVPVFSSEELMDACNGEVYFGHYHIHSTIRDTVHYVGSYSRWQFGEEEQKGFYHLTFTPSKPRYENEFIVNELAPKFNTIQFSKGSNIYASQEDLIDTLGRMDSINQDLGVEHTRYVFNIPEDYQEDTAFTKIIGERYKNNPSVKIAVKNLKASSQYKADKEVLTAMKNKYGFIFDDNLSTEDKVSYFIKDEYGKEIAPEDVKRYLTSQ